MKDGIEKIAERLLALNRENAAAESFHYLDAEEFPAEYGCLVQAVNESIGTGESRIRQERNNLEIINEIIRSGMWSMEFDASGKMVKVTWSQAFRCMLGFHNTLDFPDTLDAWSDRIHPEDKDATMRAYWAAVAGTQNYDVEYRMLTKDRGYKWFRATGEVTRREDGTPSRYIGTFIDITQKKENEQLMREKLAAQEALEKAKNELENQNDILKTLCSDYISVYRADFDSGQYEIYKMTDRLQAGGPDVLKVKSDYAATMERYISSCVVEEDRAYVRAMTDKDHVLAELKNRKNYFIRYRVKDDAKGIENFEIHFADISRISEKHLVIIGFRNVDSIVRKEEAYRLETQHDIEETLEGSKTGIWMIEMEEGASPRMYADKTMRMLLGVSEDISPEACYSSWFERIEPEYVELVEESVQEMIQTGRAEVSYPWNHPVFGQIYIRCGGVPDEKFEKPGIRLKGYHQDITETMVTRKKQEKALMEALAEAKRANLAKTEFLSHMSHDIRTPINGILGMLAISEKNQQDPVRQEECREKIRTAAEHLLSLINDVLDISKLESGTFAFAQEPFHIQDVLDSCRGILAPQAEEQGIHFVIDCADLPHVRLIGSPLHLRQILINIIGNAIKYNRPGGKVLVRMEELSAEDGLAAFRFVIEDDGIGMSEEFQKHLFEPFTQESNDARTSYRGTGLGMAITKSLVEQMGGTISVRSAPGEGSVFTVCLSVQIDAENRESALPQTEEEPADISGMRIMLVEDNEINREIAQYMLEDAGGIVCNAENGKDAVDIFAGSQPGEIECILMDVMMPVMDGLEATRVIRNLDRADAKTVPIIALSANAFVEDAQKAKEAGMNEHLSKPLDTAKMFRVIASYRKNMHGKV